MAKSRHAVAHHVWAYTNELPDALLLVEPEAYSEIFVNLQKAREQQPTGWIMIHPDRSRTMVYRDGDFRQTIENLRAVAKCTTFLINYLDAASLVGWFNGALAKVSALLF